MNFLEFSQQFKKHILFSVRDIEKLYPNFNKMNLLTWQKKGYLRKIRNTWYCFSDTETDENTLFYMANKIYHPSYVSLESALYYYGIIPEAVFSVHSITTLKTQRIKNKSLLFSYSNLKLNCFFGYTLVQKGNYTFKIAEPEKALLDFLYLRSFVKTADDLAALRLNPEFLKENLNLQKLSDYASFYKSKTLIKKTGLLKQLLYA